jgi:uncharacterized protein HemX
MGDSSGAADIVAIVLVLAAVLAGVGFIALVIYSVGLQRKAVATQSGAMQRVNRSLELQEQSAERVEKSIALQERGAKRFEESLALQEQSVKRIEEFLALQRETNALLREISAKLGSGRDA